MDAHCSQGGEPSDWVRIKELRVVARWIASKKAHRTTADPEMLLFVRGEGQFGLRHLTDRPGYALPDRPGAEADSNQHAD